MSLFSFNVPFEFPLHFTERAWDPANDLLVRVTHRLEPARRHRVLVVVDGELAAARPGLVHEIADYFTAHDSAIELAAPPLRVDSGERVKNDLSHTLDLLGHINAVGLDRQSFVAVVGGGAVLDMASFAAAIAHRSIRVVRFPTTVLSQADSGVGVKNGINLFGKKNFIGTFVPPFAVINDADLLVSLPLRDRIAGTIEAVKVALLKDADFFRQMETAAASLARGDLQALAPVIRRSAELHLEHICGNGDPFELGSARPLDFGHWAAHKLESITSYRLRHGEAVAIGIALDLSYSVRLGLLDREVATRILCAMEAMGFQLWDDALLDRGAGGELRLLAGLREFREHLGGELHITLLRDIGDSFEVTEMNEAAVLAGIEDLAATHHASAVR